MFLTERQKKYSGIFFAIIFATALFLGTFGTNVALAQSGQGNFDDFDEIYQDKVEECALAGLIQLALQFLLSYVSNQVPVVDFSQAIKEGFEDCLIWALKAALIEALTGRTVAWVQTGFDGNPAFITNVNDSLRDIADKAAGEYVSKFVPLLCSPFQADVQLALLNTYRSWQNTGYFNNISCTLTDAIENVDDFVNGNFSAGGWGGWFAYVGNPYNNPLGAYIEGSNDLALRLRSATGQEVLKWNFANGFLSKEVVQCYEYPVTGDGPPRPIGQDEVGPFQGQVVCDPPKIVTPGDTVKTSLEQAFQSNLDNIVSADEINEIISIAIGFITSDILSGDGGLSGYNSDDFPYDGDVVPGAEPGTDPDRPPVTTDCGTGNWLLSNAEEQGTPLSLTRNGLVLDVTPANRNIAFSLPTQADRLYSRAVVSVDVEIGPWYPGHQDEFHQLFFLQRGTNPNNFQWEENNVGIVNLRGPNQNKIVAGHNMNIQIGACTKNTTQNFTPQEGETYNFTYTYDTIAQTVTTVVRRNGAGGQVVATLTDTPTADAIQSDHPQDGGQGGFFVWIGGPDSYSAPEVPMDGWKFYNLSVSIQ